jgi:hypothetical protein
MTQGGGDQSDGDQDSMSKFIPIRDPGQRRDGGGERESRSRCQRREKLPAEEAERYPQDGSGRRRAAGWLGVHVLVTKRPVFVSAWPPSGVNMSSSS